MKTNRNNEEKESKTGGREERESKLKLSSASDGCINLYKYFGNHKEFTWVDITVD